MKVLFFPKYTEKGASSRYRMYQYLQYFNNHRIKVYPFFDDNYKPVQSLKSIKGVFYVLKLYLRRLYFMLKLNKDCLAFIQYEFTQFLLFNAFFFKIRKVKYIVDYDDAIFHYYDQHKNVIVRYLFRKKIPKVMTNAKVVITGSPYLTAFALKYNNNVIEIPTSIDMDRYQEKITNNDHDKFIIGWIGSSTTSLHLRQVIDAFRKLKSNGLKFEIRLIGYDKKENIDFKDLPVVFIDWNKDTEIYELNKFDVGIMPLIDFPFARGKCAFKLIQYMALGKPTISSDFEANRKVDRNNENLFADSTNEWIKCLNIIINNRSLFEEIGLRNKEVVKEYYSIQSNANKYFQILNSL